MIYELVEVIYLLFWILDLNRNVIRSYLRVSLILYRVLIIIIHVLLSLEGKIIIRRNQILFKVQLCNKISSIILNKAWIDIFPLYVFSFIFEFVSSSINKAVRICIKFEKKKKIANQGSSTCTYGFILSRDTFLDKYCAIISTVF